MSEGQFVISLRELAFIGFKRKWSILIVIFTTIVSVLAYVTLIASPQYEAVSKLMVRIGQESAPPPTFLGEQSVVIDQTRAYAASEIDILTSSELITKLIRELDLANLPQPPVPDTLFGQIRYYTKEVFRTVSGWINEGLIAIGFRTRLTPEEHFFTLFKNSLNVQSSIESTVITADLTLPYRDVVAVALNRLIDLYLEFRRELYHGDTAVAFFRQRTDEALKQLQTVEDKLSRFEDESGIRLLKEQKVTLLEALSAAEEETAQAHVALLIAQEKVSRLEAAKTGNGRDFAGLGDFAEGSIGHQLVLQLTDAEQKRQDLLFSQSAQSPALRRAEANIDRLLSMLGAHLQSVLDERQAVYQAKRSRQEDLQNQLDSLHQAEVTWKADVREVESAEKTYKFNNDKLEEALAVEALEEARIGNVLVIQEARTPAQPVGLSKALLLTVATIFGIIAAICWAALQEFFDHRVFTVEELARRMNAPALAVVPIDPRLRVGT